MSHIRWEPLAVGGGRISKAHRRHLSQAPQKMRATNGMICPRCWSFSVRSHGEWDGIGADHGEVILVFTCDECGCRWVSVYEVSEDGTPPTWTDFKLWENLVDERDSPRDARHHRAERRRNDELAN